MSEIRVNFGSLSRMQDGINAAWAKLEQDLADVRVFVQRLAATWDEGEARDEYIRLQTQWDNAAADLSLILQQIGGRVGDANLDFQNTEKVIADSFRP